MDLTKAGFTVSSYQACEIEWPKFVSRFSVTDTSERRRQVFCANLEQIVRHNQKAHEFEWSMKVGPFAAHTKAEMQGLLGGHALNYSAPEVRGSLFVPQLGAAEPRESVDHRSVMPPIKNQERCGSCWIFSAIDVIDYKVSTSPSSPGYDRGAGASHSEQQVLDCGPNSKPCSGGTPWSALNYLVSASSVNEKSYEYTQTKGSCKQGKEPSATVSNVKAVYGESDIAAAAVSQVVSVCIYGSDADAFQHYGSGVFNADCGSKSEGHCLGIVGYTTDYWIIRNSWGTDWGHDGYMYFKRGVNLCTIGTRGAAIADAAPISASKYDTCLKYQEDHTMCTCDTGCGLSPSETTPCACAKGTDCSSEFSGCTCCSYPSCDLFESSPICTCTNGGALGKGASSPCACTTGTNCSGSFSGCAFCDKDSKLSEGKIQDKIQAARSHTDGAGGGAIHAEK
mmetsp:Transcript_58699/g.96917  ORF Transcript_58699/g.96917 Transcript_58699/m.96917 type:complete len:452 (-) Transcript_58699:58-1413(-)